MAYKQQFLETVQMDGQDFSVFVQGLSRLAFFAYSGDSEDVVMSRVHERAILGCKNASIRQFLLENKQSNGPIWQKLPKSRKMLERWYEEWY